MKTCKNIVPNTKIKLFDFLYNNTPAYSIWIIKDCGWRVAMFYIDDEDLWSGWYPQQHKDKYVKSYSYDEYTQKGIIEIMEEK
jgi:hypothetical protein